MIHTGITPSVGVILMIEEPGFEVLRSESYILREPFLTITPYAVGFNLIYSG